MNTYHSNNGSTASHVLDKTGKERTLLEVFIMLFSQFLGRSKSLQTNELVTTVFETSNNLTDQSTLNTIRL